MRDAGVLLRRRPLEGADAGRALLSAPSLVAIAVLLINDHVLKAAFPSWLTGKLSDFAGLFFVPFVVLLPALLFVRRTALVRALVLLVYAGIGLVFVLLKIDAHTNKALVDAVQSVVPLSVVADRTDLVALMVLPPSLLLLVRPPRSEHGSGRPSRRLGPRTFAIFGVALFGMVATSSARASITDFVADSRDPDALYAVLDTTRADGVYASSDAGKSWRQVTGLEGSLVRDPTRAHVVYLLGSDSVGPTLTRIELGSTPVTFRLPTNGSRAQALVFGDGNSRFAVAPWPERRLFFAWNSELFVSSNEGLAWSSVSAPGVIRGIATTSVQDTLYVVAGSADLYRSTDAGATWEFVTVLPGTFATMAIAPDDAGLLLVGVGTSLIRSADGGATWESVYRDPSGAGAAYPRWLIEFDTASPRIYAIFGSGCCPLLRSSDRGRSWQPAGLDATDVSVAPGGRVFVLDAYRTRVLRGSGSPPWVDVDGRLPLQTP